MPLVRLHLTNTRPRVATKRRPYALFRRQPGENTAMMGNSAFSPQWSPRKHRCLTKGRNQPMFAQSPYNLYKRQPTEGGARKIQKISQFLDPRPNTGFRFPTRIVQGNVWRIGSSSNRFQDNCGGGFEPKASIKRTWPDKATPTPRFSESVGRTLRSQHIRRNRASPAIPTCRVSTHPAYQTLGNLSGPRGAANALISLKRHSISRRASVA